MAAQSESFRKKTGRFLNRVTWEKLEPTNRGLEEFLTLRPEDREAIVFCAGRRTFDFHAQTQSLPRQPERTLAKEGFDHWYVGKMRIKPGNLVAAE
jgi:hypothetical protein